MISLALGLGLNSVRGGAEDVAPFFDMSGGNWLGRSSDLTGAADGQLVSFYAKVKGTSLNANGVLISNATGRTRLRFDGNFDVILRNTSATIVAQISSSGGYDDGNPHELCFSYNGATGVAQMYVDGVLDQTDTTLTTGTVDQTWADWGVGALNAAGGSKFNGQMSRICYWNNVALDCSSLSVRAQMADPEQASSLGDNIVDFYGPTATWEAGTNQGSGGDFVYN